jgi:hypothetical protein
MSHYLSDILGRQQKKTGPPVQDTYKLTYYVTGDNSTFSNFVPSTADVEQLAKCTWEKGELDKLKCRIIKMTFWKVCQDWRAV